jgi:hypothetical protein
MLGYVLIDRMSDAISSLEELSSCLERSSNSDSAWKFAIISVHCALQGYMCIALHDGSNSFKTWKNDQSKKWQQAYDNKEELPAIPQLDFFMQLFDKLFSGNQTIDRHLICWLNETRNGLVHFNTDSYSIEKASIIVSIKEYIKAIKLTPSLALGNSFYVEKNNEIFLHLIERIEMQLS